MTDQPNMPLDQASITPHPIAVTAHDLDRQIKEAGSPVPSDVPCVHESQVDDIARALATLMGTCAVALADAGFDTEQVIDLAESIREQLG